MDVTGPRHKLNFREFMGACNYGINKTVSHETQDPCLDLSFLEFLADFVHCKFSSVVLVSLFVGLVLFKKPVSFGEVGLML